MEPWTLYDSKILKRCIFFNGFFKSITPLKKRTMEPGKGCFPSSESVFSRGPPFSGSKLLVFRGVDEKKPPKKTYGFPADHVIFFTRMGRNRKPRRFRHEDGPILEAGPEPGIWGAQGHKSPEQRMWKKQLSNKGRWDIFFLGGFRYFFQTFSPRSLGKWSTLTFANVSKRFFTTNVGN